MDSITFTFDIKEKILNNEIGKYKMRNVEVMAKRTRFVLEKILFRFLKLEILDFGKKILGFKSQAYVFRRGSPFGLIFNTLFSVFLSEYFPLTSIRIERFSYRDLILKNELFEVNCGSHFFTKNKCERVNFIKINVFVIKMIQNGASMTKIT